MATWPKAERQSTRESESVDDSLLTSGHRLRPEARKSLRHCAVGSYKHFFHEEFVGQRTLVDPLQESRAQRIGHFENTSEHSLGQGIEVSALLTIRFLFARDDSIMRPSE